MSMSLRCSCAHCATDMVAVEYRSGSWLVPEMAVYECVLCGKRRIVVYEPDAVFMGATRRATMCW